MLRNFTYEVFTEFVFTNAKGLVWCYNGLTNPNNIDKSAGDALDEIYSKVELARPLIIDCKNISGITDHAWDLFFKSIEQLKREVHFINPQRILQRIHTAKSEFCPSLKSLEDDSVFSIYFEKAAILVPKEIGKTISNHITKKIKSYIGESFYKFQNDEMHMLLSTPIYTNGEFDAAKLVSEPESFYWISLKLAEEVEAIIQAFKIGGKSVPTKLLTVSLRSSPFAASVGLLLGLQIETVDHFGPIFKNIEADLSISNTEEYIYIGDFTVGGTEIKISKAYAMMKNAKLEHAVVIGSLLKSSLYKEFNLHSLTLLEECSSIVKYSLKEN